jgi:hypothetical protein
VVFNQPLADIVVGIVASRVYQANALIPYLARGGRSTVSTCDIPCPILWLSATNASPILGF